MAAAPLQLVASFVIAMLYRWQHFLCSEIEKKQIMVCSFDWRFQQLLNNTTINHQSKTKTVTIKLVSMESILYSSDDESALIVVKTQWDTNNSDSDAEDNINSNPLEVNDSKHSKSNPSAIELLESVVGPPSYLSSLNKKFEVPELIAKPPVGKHPEIPVIEPIEPKPVTKSIHPIHPVTDVRRPAKSKAGSKEAAAGNKETAKVLLVEKKVKVLDQ